MNNITLVGRVTKDTEIRTIPGTETKVAKFSIAVDRDYTKSNGDPITDFIPIETKGTKAEFCERNFKKGRLVSIIGSLEITSKDGKTYPKVNATVVKPLDKKKDDINNIVDNCSFDDTPFVD